MEKLTAIPTTNFDPAPKGAVVDAVAELVRARDALREARYEISRINQVRGETVFNPAVTEMIDALLENHLSS